MINADVKYCLLDFAKQSGGHPPEIRCISSPFEGGIYYPLLTVDSSPSTLVMPGFGTG